MTNFKQRQSTQNNFQANCTTCTFTQFCLPVGLSVHELQQLEDTVKQRRTFMRGETLRHAGDSFKNFYAICAGAVKSVVIHSDGAEYILGFYLPGEVLGFEAIHTQKYPYALIALAETLVCELPFAEVMRLANKSPGLQQQLLKLASQRLNTDTCIHFAEAQQKVIAFLLNISERLNRTTGSQHVFELPMSRQDIGNHLGLAMETISRVLRRLQNQGLLKIEHRSIELLSIFELKTLSISHS